MSSKAVITSAQYELLTRVLSDRRDNAAEAAKQLINKLNITIIENDSSAQRLSNLQVAWLAFVFHNHSFEQSFDCENLKMDFKNFVLHYLPEHSSFNFNEDYRAEIQKLFNLTILIVTTEPGFKAKLNSVSSPSLAPIPTLPMLENEDLMFFRSDSLFTGSQPLLGSPTRMLRGDSYVRSFFAASPVNDGEIKSSSSYDMQVSGFTTDDHEQLHVPSNPAPPSTDLFQTNSTNHLEAIVLDSKLAPPQPPARKKQKYSAHTQVEIPSKYQHMTKVNLIELYENLKASLTIANNLIAQAKLQLEQQAQAFHHLKVENADLKEELEETEASRQEDIDDTHKILKTNVKLRLKVVKYANKNKLWKIKLKQYLTALQMNTELESVASSEVNVLLETESKEKEEKSQDVCISQSVEDSAANPDNYNSMLVDAKATAEKLYQDNLELQSRVKTFEHQEEEFKTKLDNLIIEYETAQKKLDEDKEALIDNLIIQHALDQSEMKHKVKTLEVEVEALFTRLKKLVFLLKIYRSNLSEREEIIDNLPLSINTDSTEAKASVLKNYMSQNKILQSELNQTHARLAEVESQLNLLQRQTPADTKAETSAEATMVTESHASSESDIPAYRRIPRLSFLSGLTLTPNLSSQSSSAVPLMKP